MKMNLPTWARKPKHKKEVIATPRGWMVKETGEYLKLVKNLTERLKSVKDEVSDYLEEAGIEGVERTGSYSVSTSETNEPKYRVVDTDFDFSQFINKDQDTGEDESEDKTNAEKETSEDNSKQEKVEEEVKPKKGPGRPPKPESEKKPNQAKRRRRRGRPRKNESKVDGTK